MGQLSVRTRVLIGVAALAIGLTFGWVTTSRDEEPPEPATATTPISNVTSPAAQLTVECANLGIIRERDLPVTRLSDALRGYAPTYVPVGAGFARTWREGPLESGAGAQWVTTDCQTVDVRLYPMDWNRDRGWRVHTSGNCRLTRLGETTCIALRAHVDEGLLVVTTAGFTKDEAIEVARSIPL